MRVREIMSTDVITIAPDTPARAAWSRMTREGVRHLLVTEGERLIGVVSDRDLGGPAGEAVRRGWTVRDVMNRRVARIGSGATLRQAANVMRGRSVGSLPVVDNGRVVGIVTATDVLEELGRGSRRPAERARQQAARVPPASLRRSAKPDGAAEDGAPALPSPKSRPGVAPGRPAPRLRGRRADSLKRSPMPARVPRRVKRVAGCTTAPETPVYVRAVGATLKDSDRDYLRRKLGRKLGKFATGIERASVRVEDINGPRGGVDKRCQIKVVLAGLPSVVVDERHHKLQAAMDGALARIERAVRQTLGRRRTKPLKQRRSPPAASVSI